MFAHGGIKAEDKEFVVLIELFMMQLLKLAEGDLKLQRKKEVCRVQSFVESLDKLRARNHDMSRSANPRDQELPGPGKSVLFFCSKDFNNHNTTVETV
ncbi:unnamed protein product [Arabis nemorensis]|uniref:BAG domain-containing protein n=1 Tax=Arabis nemorensis TaxID=586526 RepID=A0A565CRV3_9BRAS|nr:unnamed protein product [Arabis nemorensis]